MMRGSIVAVGLLSMLANVVEAQRPVPIDSIFARAERLVAASAPSASHYPAALALKAKLAATASDAEYAYLRIVVEYPLTPEAKTALRKLADYEEAQGDRAGAARHLTRLIDEYPEDRDYGNTAFKLSQLLMEQNRLPEACGVLLRAYATTPHSAAELRNRLEFAAGRCNGVDTSARTAPVNAPPAGVNVPARGAQPPSSATSGRFTVQVGAYDTKAEADRSATRLRALGHEARVIGARKPFRVHVGRFETRVDADVLSKALTAQKITNFVTPVVPDGR
jgi:tetratricopeptide (TPR) repeat protein